MAPHRGGNPPSRNTTLIVVAVSCTLFGVLLISSPKGLVFGSKKTTRVHQNKAVTDQPKTETKLSANGQDISKTVTIRPKEEFHDPVEMPRIGLGTAGLQDSTKLVTAALQAGYRAIDTAAQIAVWYQNEDKIGAVLDSFKQTIPRNEIFITTKLHPEDLGTEPTKNAVSTSLTLLKTSYIDLYLIHAPVCWQGFCSKQPKGDWKESWRAMEDLYREGKLKLLGVSNFWPDLLDELYQFAAIKPHVIQNWCDPFHQDRLTRKWAAERGIVYTAYSSLGTQWSARGKQNPVTNSVVLKSIANRMGKSIPQVVLRWQLQHNLVVIPKTNSAEHAAQNLLLFGWSLSDADMTAIDALEGSNE
eukprot:TRINITY_DN67655_c5_g1_i1.p1 TRINITY_DN67655_c5_g1~~TRINITY_DN67655_c5_g1_i1.p1  ORF type:complete len:359 (-),score=21.99 TRINITY_DN67655_c5_g1_i1:114-1190(-)